MFRCAVVRSCVLIKGGYLCNTARLSVLPQFRMASSNSRYDLVVYGATGFTGQYVVEEVAQIAESERIKMGSQDATLRWAIAGRDSKKMLKTLEEARKETGLPLTGVEILEADVENKDSLDKMTSQAKVVINTVGPYTKYGEPVVVSCIENGADHVDISGEPQFLEGMQLRHHKAAEEKGVHIVGACGYDSIPAEIGINYLTQEFKGAVNSVELFGSTRAKSGSMPPINTGTMESAILAISNRGATAIQHAQLYPVKMPKPKYRVASSTFVHQEPALNCYGVPFPSDAPVVYRTQRYRHDELHQHPIQFRQYLMTRTFMQAFLTLMGFVYFSVMASIGFTRTLLIKYPSALTGGVFSRGNISRENLKSVRFSMSLIAKGWSYELAESSDQYTAPPDQTKILKIEGADPAYKATSTMMVASAMTLLREKQHCANKGGVLTPGVTFANTNILQRLRNRDMKFDIKN